MLLVAAESEPGLPWVMMVVNVLLMLGRKVH